MKIRVAVCEKDQKQREYVIANLSALSIETECKGFTNIYDVKETFQESATAYDVIFLAASVHQKGDGVELASYLRGLSQELAIILMADNKDYYQEAYEAFVMAYIFKPVKFRDLDRCMTFYTKNTKIERRASWMVKSKGGHWRRIFCRDIVMIESNNREFIVHLSDGTSLESYGKLGEVSEQFLLKILYAVIKVTSSTCSM